MDADGYDDLLIGSRYAGTYLLLGPATGTVDLAAANAKLSAEFPEDMAGECVSGAGDVDGDGHDDVLVGAPLNGEGGPHAGAAYLLLGPVTGRLELSRADAKLVESERASRPARVSPARVT